MKNLDKIEKILIAIIILEVIVNLYFWTPILVVFFRLCASLGCRLF